MTTKSVTTKPFVRRLLNRRTLAALCGPGAKFLGLPRYKWPDRAVWDRRPRPLRRRKLRLVAGKERHAMNQYERVR